MDISVIVPLYNEDESLPELSAWIARVMEANRFTYEVIMVDDGSNDNSWQIIESLSSQYKSHKIQTQLWEIGSSTLRFSGGSGRCGHYHGRRYAG